MNWAQQTEDQEVLVIQGNKELIYDEIYFKGWFIFVTIFVTGN